jgi:hypothetical protein
LESTSSTSIEAMMVLIRATIDKQRKYTNVVKQDSRHKRVGTTVLYVDESYISIIELSNPGTCHYIGSQTACKPELAERDAIGLDPHQPAAG